MAVDLKSLREGVAANVTSAGVDLNVYSRFPGIATTPCAIVYPSDPLITRDQAMGRGLVTVRLEVVVLVGTSSLADAEASLEGFVDTVVDAVLNDRTLGGAAQDIQLETVSGFDQFQFDDGAVHLGFRALLLVLVDDS